MRIKFETGARVAYVPTHANGDVKHPDVEFGVVSSVSENFTTVFVKFDKQVERLGAEEATAKGCYPEDLVLAEMSKSGLMKDAICIRCGKSGKKAPLIIDGDGWCFCQPCKVKREELLRDLHMEDAVDEQKRCETEEWANKPASQLDRIEKMLKKLSKPTMKKPKRDSCVGCMYRCLPLTWEEQKNQQCVNCGDTHRNWTPNNVPHIQLENGEYLECLLNDLEERIEWLESELSTPARRLIEDEITRQLRETTERQDRNVENLDLRVHNLHQKFTGIEKLRAEIASQETAQIERLDRNLESIDRKAMDETKMEL